MRKYIIILIGVMLCHYALGRNYTTKTDGDYSSPVCWDMQPEFVISFGDTVFINHNITLDIVVKSVGVFYIGVNGAISGDKDIKINGPTGVLINYGKINTTQDIHIDGIWYNYSYSYSNIVHNDGIICNTDIIEMNPKEEFDQHGGQLNCGGTIIFCNMIVHDGVLGVSEFNSVNLDTCSCGSSYIKFDDPAIIDSSNVFICGISINPEFPLPIELLDFGTNILANNKVELIWETSSEINNDYFTIERSTDGLFWKYLHNLKGAGNSSSYLNYSYIDYEPHFGTSYYRLKQTDYDGKYSYSNIISVKVDKSPINIYPNPVHDILNVSGVDLEINQVKVYNSLGQDVTPLISVNKSRSATLVCDLSGLAIGVYFVKVNNNSSKLLKR